MITVRNADLALPVSARTGAADMKPGMLVKFAAGAASGDQPTVVRAVAADIDSWKAGALTLGIVDYNKQDSQDVDFDVNVAAQTLTAQDNTIPQDAQVVVWLGKPVIAYHSSMLEASLAPATVREPQAVAFLASTSKPTAYNGAATNTGEENYVGFVYRVDGPEVTIAFSL